MIASKLNRIIVLITSAASISYEGSDGTTRDESNAERYGTANQGSSYWISPEGQRITLTWTADENGFQPKGDHLPTPPPMPEEIARMLPTLPKLVEEPYHQAAYAKPAYKPAVY